MTPVAKAVVVEDDRDLLFLYTHKLASQGFEVEGAVNGEEGLALIERLRPDIVLVDLLMPVMSGTEMLSRLRAQEWASEMRIIVLTNISRDEAPQALRFLNVDRFVAKAHHTPAQILSIVHEVLGIQAI